MGPVVGCRGRGEAGSTFSGPPQLFSSLPDFRGLVNDKSWMDAKQREEVTMKIRLVAGWAMGMALGTALAANAATLDPLALGGPGEDSSSVSANPSGNDTLRLTISDGPVPQTTPSYHFGGIETIQITSVGPAPNQDLLTNGNGGILVPGTSNIRVNNITPSLEQLFPFVLEPHTDADGETTLHLTYLPNGAGNQAAVPVPAPLFLLGSGIAGLAGARLRRKR